MTITNLEETPPDTIFTKIHGVITYAIKFN